MLKQIFFIFNAFLFMLLSACSPTTAPFLTAAKTVVKSPQSEVILNPSYRYLRTSFISYSVLLPTPVAYLALGSTQNTPNGICQIWYSKDREIIKLCNGRLCGSLGLPVDWREVRLENVPTWDSVRKSNRTYKRWRFVMPGYHFGIKDYLSIHQIAVPKRTYLWGIQPNSLVWFQEDTKSYPKERKVPVARYAVDFSRKKPKVVYSEQCLAKNLCFAFQLWDVKPQ